MLLALRRHCHRSAVISRLIRASARVHAWCKWRTLAPSALVVDDDPDILPLVKAALSPYSVSSEGVDHGTAALARLRSHRYDLVILDLKMPELTGFDVLRVLKTEARLREIPVIVLTSNASDEALARSFGYGADDFVAKPFKATQLGMRAYRLLYPSRAR